MKTAKEVSHFSNEFPIHGVYNIERFIEVT